MCLFIPTMSSHSDKCQNICTEHINYYLRERYTQYTYIYNNNNNKVKG